MSTSRATRSASSSRSDGTTRVSRKERLSLLASRDVSSSSNAEESGVITTSVSALPLVETVTDEPCCSCDELPMRNVLLEYKLYDLTRRADTNFWLGLICLGVCAVNFVLMYLNWLFRQDHPDHDDDDTTTSAFVLAEHVSHRTFHMLEFWTTCLFSTAEAFALIMTSPTQYYQYHHHHNQPHLLKLLLFFNVLNSMIPALLITLDFCYFETLAHELEFLNSWTLAFVTMILLLSLIQPPETTSTEQPQSTHEDSLYIIIGGVACLLVAIMNCCVYNLGRASTAHYLELSFNVVMSLVTFWFCLENRFQAQMEIGQLLYGRQQPDSSVVPPELSPLRIPSRRPQWHFMMFGGTPKLLPVMGRAGTTQVQLAQLDPIVEEQHSEWTPLTGSTAQRYRYRRMGTL
ncbi:expressed unknown protein [Seminavis robusta]|uniref:Transmembrane protein n=1 Tax=Seminavis robusta TaxID=568900 RepID=A0A9N8DFB4_9STRA|nr:expressed unknown protein [Seminavis robusta]|eukprot:Sro122_g059270.1 n/a (403) ;mRNA; r:68997-70205